MAEPGGPDIYLSLFMFTADLRPGDDDYAALLVAHLKAMRALGYAGFDMPIAAIRTWDHGSEIAGYRRLRTAIDRAGLGTLGFTTNVGATAYFDPTSPDAGARAAALAYLKSRVDITHVLGGGSIMAGPFLFPYGVFPTTDMGAALRSDALQDWLLPRCANAHALFEELGAYAADKGIALAIEPVDHWETPGPNTVTELLRFLDDIRSDAVGATFDTAHIMLGSTGPDAFRADVAAAVDRRRLNYVHISPPDRGSLGDCWIPWGMLLPTLLPAFSGPYLVEVFNAVPPFTDLMRLSRRRFWIPGEDPDPGDGRPSAYDVARDAIAILRRQIDRYR